jgi:RHS repeat-associated protein
MGITYPAQPGKQTALAYDGLDRRAAITSTPAGGGSAVTTSYLWCGSQLCQARNATNSPTRGYYAEGELVPGMPAQSYYYGTDQLGSVRRVFTSTTSAPAYSYDPYGSALQATAPLTDFGYAGMFYNADSGLYLTQYRAYNPAIGRWLSRDPLGEKSDQAANLYAYVAENPISGSDPSGLDGIFVSFVGYSVDTGARSFGGGISLPLGHAGVIAVDPQTGDTMYFDFGLYGGEYGDVRGPFNVGDIIFDDQGIPTRASVDSVLDKVSNTYGKGYPVYSEYYKNADAGKISDYAKDLQQNTQNHPYHALSHNCKNFARDAIAAGGGTSLGIISKWQMR